ATGHRRHGQSVRQAHAADRDGIPDRGTSGGRGLFGYDMHDDAPEVDLEKPRIIGVSCGRGRWPRPIMRYILSWPPAPPTRAAPGCNGYSRLPEGVKSRVVTMPCRYRRDDNVILTVSFHVRKPYYRNTSFHN